MGDKERISPEGYIIADDEQARLRALCGGPKRPMDMTVVLSSDPSEGPHRAETVTDRLAWLSVAVTGQHERQKIS